jgi:hypothetical protein
MTRIEFRRPANVLDGELVLHRLAGLDDQVRRVRGLAFSQWRIWLRSLLQSLPIRR